MIFRIFFEDRVSERVLGISCHHTRTNRFISLQIFTTEPAYIKVRLSSISERPAAWLLCVFLMTRTLILRLSLQLMLATEFEKFGKGLPQRIATRRSETENFLGERFHGLMGPLLGHGIFNTDGAPWKFHRSMSRPFFAKEKIRHFQIFDRHANDAVGQIRDRLREGVPMDIQVRRLSASA